MEDINKNRLWPIAEIASVYLALGITAFSVHQSKLTSTQEPAKQVQKQEEPTRIVSYIPTEDDLLPTLKVCLRANLATARVGFPS